MKKLLLFIIVCFVLFTLYYEYTTYKHLMNISKTDETVNDYLDIK
jgi:hypothetical protein